MLLSVMYLLWSLLYLALSLERAAQSAQSLQLALKEAEVQRLLGQLSPHFTFNTINNIRALILKDPEAARSMLGKFAATLRYQFADAPQAAVILAMNCARCTTTWSWSACKGRACATGRTDRPGGVAAASAQVLAAAVAGERDQARLGTQPACRHSAGRYPDPGRQLADGRAQQRATGRALGCDWHWPEQSRTPPAVDVSGAASLNLSQDGDCVLAWIASSTVHDPHRPDRRFRAGALRTGTSAARIPGDRDRRPGRRYAVAHALIEAQAPDLLLLDIDLPGGNAFELLERLEQIPQIIFTTAFDAYALQAFAYNTVDYLLKPIEPERLAQAIAKWRPAQSAARDRLNADSPIFVKDGERCFLVKAKEIRLIRRLATTAACISARTHRCSIARSGPSKRATRSPPVLSLQSQAPGQSELCRIDQPVDQWRPAIAIEGRHGDRGVAAAEQSVCESPACELRPSAGVWAQLISRPGASHGFL